MTVHHEQSCGQWETWDYCALDVDRLTKRAAVYAHKAGAKSETIGLSLCVMFDPARPQQATSLLRHALSMLLLAEALKAMLESKVGKRLASLTQQQLFGELINDAYKPKMHKIYATYLRGVKVDFALNVRKSPFELKKLEQEVVPDRMTLLN